MDGVKYWNSLQGYRHHGYDLFRIRRDINYKKIFIENDTTQKLKLLLSDRMFFIGPKTTLVLGVSHDTHYLHIYDDNNILKNITKSPYVLHKNFQSFVIKDTPIGFQLISFKKT